MAVPSSVVGIPSSVVAVPQYSTPVSVGGCAYGNGTGCAVGTASASGKPLASYTTPSVPLFTGAAARNGGVIAGCVVGVIGAVVGAFV